MIELTTGVAFLLSSMYGSTGVSTAVATVSQANTSILAPVSNVLVLQDRKAVEEYLKKIDPFAPLPVD